MVFQQVFLPTFWCVHFGMTGRGSKKRARPSGDTVDKTPEKSTENKASKSKDDKKASQDNSKVTPAPRFGNRFSKMTKLGSGTFGEVWKGFDDEFGRWVAIKKFQEVKSDHLGINMMVIREISLLRQLDHPNIARTIDVLIGKKINCDSLLLVMVRMTYPPLTYDM